MTIKELYNFLVGSGITIAFIVVLFKYKLEKKIDENFEKKLAEHKSELQSMRDAATFDYQRKMHDFSIYSSNRHSIYNNLYQKILVAKKSIKLLSITPIEVDDLIPKNQNEFEDMLYFRKYEFDEGEQDYIEKLWGEKNIEVLKNIIICLEKKKRTKDARENLTKLEKIFLENELFLSEEVSSLTSQLIKKVNSFIKNYINVMDDVNKESKYNTINDLHEKIKRCMKKELSIGFYSSD